MEKLDGFKADMVNMGSGWPFLYGFFFSLKMVLMFIHVVRGMNPAFFFPP